MSLDAKDDVTKLSTLTHGVEARQQLLGMTGIDKTQFLLAMEEVGWLVSRHLWRGNVTFQHARVPDKKLTSPSAEESEWGERSTLGLRSLDGGPRLL